MLMFLLWLSFAFVESSTVMVAVKAPDVVGAPLMVPALPMERPPGRPPADQVYGETPPVAAKLAEYGVPTVPDGRVVVEIARGASGGAAPLNARISIA